MNLEQAILALTAAVIANTEAMTGGKCEGGSTEAMTGGKCEGGSTEKSAGDEKSKGTRTRKTADKADKADTKPGKAEITYDEMSTNVVKYSELTSKADAKQLIIDVTGKDMKLTAVPEEFYAKLNKLALAELKKLEDDAESEDDEL